MDITLLNNVFRPHAPIDQADMLSGRTTQLQDIELALRAVGKHVIIYGDRGVGKTSLANSSLDKLGVCKIVYRCAVGDTYNTVFSGVLNKLGLNCLKKGMVVDYSQNMNASVSVPMFAKAKIESERGKQETFEFINDEVLSPNFVEERISQLDTKNKYILLLDEFDRIDDEETKIKVADTIKKISDATLSTKIVIVGVSESVEQLIGKHESIVRNIAQIHLNRMQTDELNGILEIGERKLNITFKDEVKGKIVNYSDGFPYYTHLLALCSCQSAHARDSSEVNIADFNSGLEMAVRNVEETLKSDYENAIATIKGLGRFKNVLWSMALDNSIEVSTTMILHKLFSIEGKKLLCQHIIYQVGKLSEKERRNIITKVRKGCYKFSNPLMRAYIRFRIKNEMPELME